MASQLELTVRAADERYSAHLITMSPLRAIVAIPDLPTLMDDTSVRLRFDSKRLGRPVEVGGHAYHPPCSRSPTWLGIVFATWADPQGWRRLQRLSNRRERVRVVLPQPASTRIRTPRHKGCVHGVVRDLSVSGLGLDIAPERAIDLPAGQVVHIQTTLGGVRMNLKGTVRRHKTLSRSQYTRVGVQLFDLSPPETRALTRMVMSCQILRPGAGT